MIKILIFLMFLLYISLFFFQNQNQNENENENFEIKGTKNNEHCRKMCMNICFSNNIRGSNFSHRSFEEDDESYCDCLC